MAIQYDEILAGNCFGQINVLPPAAQSDNSKTIEIKAKLKLQDEFHLSIEQLFHLAREFLKANQDIQLKYSDNVRLIALLKQIKIGPWKSSYTENIGFLDVIGNDRKQAWISLGNMSKEFAMEEYVNLLLQNYSLFRIHLENYRLQNTNNSCQRENDETRQILEEQAEKVRQYELKQVTKLEKKNRKREEIQKKQIQDILNQQTYSQFKAFAEQQYKDNRQAQEELIQQLQEQHFNQYMQQVYQQQLLDQQQLHRIKPNMDQQQQQSTENVPQSGVILVPPSTLNIIIPPPATNVNPSTAQSNTPQGTSIPPTMASPTNTYPVPTNVYPPPTTATPTSTPTNMASPTSSLPPVFNPVNIVTAPSPTANIPLNTASFVPNVPSPSVAQMPPPLGPAPAQLPPLVHPPPPSSIPIQPIANVNLDSTIPVQNQFEALNLNSPSEPVPNDLIQPGIPLNNELSPSQELVNGQSAVSSSVDANGEIPLAPDDTKPESPNIVPANMWTRKDIKEFKEQIRKEKEAVIKISSGETVTVRVPTHEDGQLVFWEFATDYYDLGFGVYFEWTKAQSNTVTVHVSDSSDEEEENEDGEKKDIEKGSGSTNKPPKPRQDEIVPIYRRDCHEEVYAGSHPYPGQGIYLLKFDNSYSLWRSKTLYYRVYYSK